MHAGICGSYAFIIQTPQRYVRDNQLCYRGPKLRMIPDVSSLLTAVEVFDGSTIVDPVVVSGVFWTSLKARLLAVVIGQALAAAAFAMAFTFLAPQISQAGEFVSQKLFQSDLDSPRKTFIKATDLPKRDADFGKLLICLAIDIIGSSSELVPILGELTDVVYAPVAATLLRSLYGGSNVIFALEFAEEILPFTDILPLATICWVVETYFPDSDLAKLLRVGNYNYSNMSSDAIDVNSESTKLPNLPEKERQDS
eukprot:scaffold20430_cov120-Cylindrotheca_fusiformis.AAC.2